MKSILILVTLAVIFLQAQCKPQYLKPHIIKQISDECADEVLMDKAVLEDFKNSLNLPKDTVYKNFLNCIYKRQGYLAKNGSINRVHLKKFLRTYTPISTVGNIVDECTNDVPGKYTGEIIHNALDCMISKHKVLDSEEFTNEI